MKFQTSSSDGRLPAPSCNKLYSNCNYLPAIEVVPLSLTKHDPIQKTYLLIEIKLFDIGHSSKHFYIIGNCT